MKNIYLVRHGQSLANIDKAINASTPDHAIELSDLGREQARAAGVALGSLLSGEATTPTRIWTSPYLRTRETAKYIQAELAKKFLHLDCKEHINLCEQQFGLFDGIPDDQLASRFPQEHAHYDLAAKHEGKFWARMPMGESRMDVAVRVHQAFGTFHRDADRHGIENIVVVCHGVVLRAFVMQWRHLPYEWFEAQKNPGNCAIYHLGESEDQDRGYIHQAETVLNPPAYS